MFAYYRKTAGPGPHLTHTWEVEHIARDTEDGVQVDDHHIDDAELVKVESKAAYMNGGQLPEDADEELDGAINRLKAVLST